MSKNCKHNYVAETGSTNRAGIYRRLRSLSLEEEPALRLPLFLGVYGDCVGGSG